MDVGSWGNIEQEVDGDENVTGGDAMCEEKKRPEFDVQNLLYS